MKGWLAGALGVAGIAIAGTLYQRYDAGPAPSALVRSQAVAVSTTRVRVVSMVDQVVSYGNLAPVRSVNVVADSPALVAGLLFKDGAEVEAGTPLVTLDPRIAQAQVQAARAQAEAEMQNLRRTQSLARQGLDSTSSLEQAQARAAVSQSDVLIKQRQLDQLTLRAPFAGRLGARRVDAGAFVNGGDLIVRIDDVAELLIEFRMPSVVLQRAADGMRVQLRVPNAGDLAAEGKLSFIDPAVSTDTRSVLLRAVIPNGDGRLRPGLFVRVTIDLAVHPNALVVPVGAVTRELNAAFVFVVDDAGVVRKTPVRLGLSDDADTEIVAGVKTGDQVVTVGQFKLREGDRVKIIPGPVQSSARTLAQRTEAA